MYIFIVICLIPYCIKNTAVVSSCSEEQLSCCLDLHEQGLSELDVFASDLSLLDVPDFVFCFLLIISV